MFDAARFKLIRRARQHIADLNFEAPYIVDRSVPTPTDLLDRAQFDEM